jgi:arylsulfatase A-like enzyme
LAEKLKGAGYATGMIGKWHIGFKEGLRPHERGFDYHYGFLSGAHKYLSGREDNRSQPSSRTSTRMATASQREKKSRRITLAVVTRKCRSHELFLR